MQKIDFDLSGFSQQDTYQRGIFLRIALYLYIIPKMNLTAEQSRDKTNYEALARSAEKRLKPGEERIWDVMPYDPKSPYHNLDNVVFPAHEESAPGFFHPEAVRGLAGYVVSGYSKDSGLIEANMQRLDEIVSDIGKTVGPAVKELLDAGQRVAFFTGHQSRFETLVFSFLMQSAIADDTEQQKVTRLSFSTVVTRYLGCYGLRLDEMTGDPNFETRNALDVARNVSEIITVFPRTEIREELDIDERTQNSVNSRAIRQSTIPQGIGHARSIAACAASDKELPEGGYQIAPVGKQAKKLYSYDWHTFGVAAHLDYSDPDNSFFEVSQPTPAYKYSKGYTLDDHYTWIANTRQERTGEPVIYIPEVN